MKRQLLTILLIMLTVSFASAQEKGSYIWIGGGAGLSGVLYDITDGSTKLGLGFHGNINYSYFFAPYWGIGSGIQISSYSTKATLNNHQIIFWNQTDEAGDTYDKHIYLNSWTEKQKAVFLEIPLLLQYQYKFSSIKHHGFYVALGAKAQFPLNADYKVTGGTETEGYYDQWHVLLYELPQYGFGPDSPKTQGGLDLKTSFAATGEFGFLFGLKPNIDLYLGAYCDYGFTKLNESSTEQDVIYLNEADRQLYQAVLNSKLTDKANAFSVGGKIGLRLRLEKSKPSTRLPKEFEANILKPETDTIIKIDTVRITKVDTVYLAKEYTSVDKLMDSILLELIFFDLNSYQLRDESKKNLDKKILYMKKNAKINILIIGNTCNLGSEEINVPLSINRAEAARRYMIEKDIAPKRIKILGAASQNPMAPNTSEFNRHKNRRNDFYIWKE